MRHPACLSPLRAHEQVARRHGWIAQLAYLDTIPSLLEIQREIKAQPLLERPLVRMSNKLKPSQTCCLCCTKFEAARCLTRSQVQIQRRGKTSTCARALTLRGDAPSAKGAEVIHSGLSAVALSEKLAGDRW